MSSLFAVISDVHANLNALTAVLKDIKQRGIRSILFIGDAVGYGENPNECIEILREECDVFLAGNHDWTVAGLDNTEGMSAIARESIEWIKREITKDNLHFLKARKLVRLLKKEDMLLVHSSPYNPRQWFYIFDLKDAEISFWSFTEKVCIVGHTHTPSIIKITPTGKLSYSKNPVRFDNKNRYIVNVGSAGNPRDSDTHGSYAIVGKRSGKIIRVEIS